VSACVKQVLYWWWSYFCKPFHYEIGLTSLMQVVLTTKFCCENKISVKLHNVAKIAMFSKRTTNVAYKQHFSAQ